MTTAALQKLTLRERQVLIGLANGQATKEIAAELGISTKTVETHRLNIKRALGIDSIAELTKFAVREGLVKL